MRVESGGDMERAERELQERDNAIIEAAQRVVTAYDNAPAVCCPRCEMEPEGAIWSDHRAYRQPAPEPTLHDAIEALRTLLKGA